MVTLGEKLHEISKHIFLEKKKKTTKTINILLSAELAQRVVNPLMPSIP